MTEANQNVTAAILQAEEALALALDSWKRVAEAERLCRLHADRSSPQSSIGAYGQGRAECVVAVLRALRGL